MNKVTLIGHIGQAPEIHHFDSGSCTTKFSLATNDGFYDKEGEWQDRTDWHNIVLFNKAAERAEKQLQKGYQVVVEGKLKHRSYENSEGEKKHITEVVCHYFRNLTKVEKSDRPSDEAPTPEPGQDMNF